MEHSLDAYLRRLSTVNLEQFLQDCKNKKYDEDFTYAIEMIEQVLAERKEQE